MRVYVRVCWGRREIGKEKNKHLIDLGLLFYIPVAFNKKRGF